MLYLGNRTNRVSPYKNNSKGRRVWSEFLQEQIGVWWVDLDGWNMEYLWVYFTLSKQEKLFKKKPKKKNISKRILRRTYYICLHKLSPFNAEHSVMYVYVCSDSSCHTISSWTTQQQTEKGHVYGSLHILYKVGSSFFSCSNSVSLDFEMCCC